jgi:hypothetical protein
MPQKHLIEKGESVISLSDQLGFFAETIWNHGENSDLRDKREDMNILMPGDILYIPDKTQKEVEKSIDQRHIFRRKGIPALFRLQLFVGEEPRARQKYKLTVDGKTVYGTANEQGVVTKYISAQAKEGELVIGPDRLRIQLYFGYLDPLREWIGVKKRLVNLGYDCGELDNAPNDETRRALHLFQKRFSIKPSGEVDPNNASDPTLQRLRKLHDKDEMYPNPTE